MRDLERLIVQEDGRDEVSKLETWEESEDGQDKRDGETVVISIRLAAKKKEEKTGLYG